MRFLILPLILFGLPLAEIAGFVLVGRTVGLWATLGLVLLSTFVGLALLRIQGLAVLRQINRDGREGLVPGKALVDGAMIVIAALLLIIPGFLSDIVGILLFIPPVRDIIWRQLGQRLVVRTGRSGSNTSGRRSENPAASTIDLDAEEFKREPGSSSPWSIRNDDKR
jgi:UPF0716 protein FxsA